MSTKAGQLLWRRAQITLEPGVTDFDTGLTQLNRAFENSSIDEPGLGSTPFPIDPNDGSRIQVIPLAPLNAWATVLNAEPFLDPTTNTIHVLFAQFVDEVPVTINVLFWDPHTAIGPGRAMTYLTEIDPQAARRTAPGGGGSTGTGPGTAATFAAHAARLRR